MHGNAFAIHRSTMPSAFHAAASLRDAFPLRTNTLLNFSLADRSLFTAYLWPVQAQHRYGNSLPTSLLLLSMPKQYPETPSYCSSLLRRSSPKLLHSLHSHRSSLLPWPLQNIALLVLIFALLRFGSTELFFSFLCFCLTMRCSAIAAPHISSLYQLHSLSAPCYRCASRRFARAELRASYLLFCKC